jgi:predicted nuclease of restriction endonuclease-like (RecB) superfamily
MDVPTQDHSYEENIVPKKKVTVRNKASLRPEFYQSIAEILQNARRNTYHAINFTMVEAYWNVGRMIVEEEQKGKATASYGEALIRNLSARLTIDFGKGFNISNVFAFRQFYLSFSKFRTVRGISANDVLGVENPRSTPSILRRELSWSHYRLLIRIEKEKVREWYMSEAAEQNWSTRALERQINSLYYERLIMSKDKAPVREEMQKKTAPLAPSPEDFIRDPYILEFLGLPDVHQFRESELEQAIVDKLQAFILELGRGFAFVARQKRVSTETKDFYIDLVFYNYILKCFVLIDLKTGELTHQDIGQMDMYVRLYEDKLKGPDDNPTIGIILCTEKDATVVKYSMLKENKRLFASKYKLYLPTEQELIEEIEKEKALIVRERGEGYAVSSTQ